ncbi:germ cell nuclear acidic protein-like [Leguminivora glycinivorella]|uniref:germ cell nuclear acidic protein-like n=1 Tax=Leguminivora glycinivorella TaxID=1035111 RepID=UPI00200CC182|nr:germ cell nuclear acidic protein-like [Leguminivora glycinivorella]
MDKVLLTLASPLFGKKNNILKKNDDDWFFNKAERVFFRESTVLIPHSRTEQPHDETTYPDTPPDDFTEEPESTTEDGPDFTIEPDHYDTQSPTEPDDDSTESPTEPNDDTESPIDPDYDNTESPLEPDDATRVPDNGPSTEPDYNSELPPDDGNTEAPVPDYNDITEPEYYTVESRTEYPGQLTEEPDTATEEPTTPDNDEDIEVPNAYYEKRKNQALSCKGNEHATLKLDELGNPDCQLCTCNGAGILFCSRIPCSDDGVETGQHHEQLLQETDKTLSLILREYATDCKPGTKVQTKHCTCSCVLRSVMSCPKDCFSHTEDATIHIEESYEKVEQEDYEYNSNSSNHSSSDIITNT